MTIFGLQRCTQVGMGQMVKEKNSWQKGRGMKAGKGKEKSSKGEARACWACGKIGHIAARCRKGGKHNLYAIGEDDSEHVNDATDNEEDM